MKENEAEWERVRQRERESKVDRDGYKAQSLNSQLKAYSALLLGARL